MTPGFIIAGILALVRLIRVRRSGVVRTSFVAFVCLLIGTACEVVLISVELFGAGDPRMIAGLVARVLVQTAQGAMLGAVPFMALVVGAQLVRKRIGL